MHKLSQPDAMIFDLDGTLFQTETLLIPAYHQTFDQLRAEGLYTGATPPEERILECLGLLLDEIWRRVIPEASEFARQRANVLLLQFQLEGLSQGIGALYDGVPEVLEALQSKGVRLFVASNGLEDYVKGVVQYLGIGERFEAVYSAGEFETESKVDLVRMLLERYELRSAWMVGDRSSDVEAGKGNGLPVIGCRYAEFGSAEELRGADRMIASFEELIELCN